MSIPTMPPMSLWGDICIFKGQPCVADKNGRTLMIGENLSVFLLANPVFGSNVKFLVESECDLLLVDYYGFDTSPCYQDRRTIRFDVFKLDEKEKKWVKLTTLGDRVLFVDQECSFSASASDLHVAKGNCIIFTRNSPYGCHPDLQYAMRIFHLNRDDVSPLSKYPDFLNLFWPPPNWILDLQKLGTLCSLALYLISFATCTYGNTSMNFDIVFLTNVVLDKLKLVCGIQFFLWKLLSP
jgi:hypothetical protein